ncbi:hypothetical protein [Gudongella sp. SC589]|uniref:hypothetical protein n=1 Tax=Gudongella sp. SC589 TaxID=3385990 RepID=UPI003904AA66
MAEKILSQEYIDKTYTVNRHLAMTNNYYKVRYEAYREALREVIDVSPDPFATRIAEDALKLEKQKSEDAPCETCLTVTIENEYVYCPMCGRARR